MVDQPLKKRKRETIRGKAKPAEAAVAFCYSPIESIFQAKMPGA